MPSRKTKNREVVGNGEWDRLDKSTLPLFSGSIQSSRVGDAVWDQNRRRGVFVVPPLVIVARVGLVDIGRNHMSFRSVGRTRRCLADCAARFGRRPRSSRRVVDPESRVARSVIRGIRRVFASSGPESNIRIAVLKKPSVPLAAQSRPNGAAFDRLFAFHHQPVDRRLSPFCEESADETTSEIWSSPVRR